MDAVQAMTGPGRLADVGVPHAGRRAVLRRHLLPAGAAPRHAVVPPGARRGSPTRGDERRDEIVAQAGRDRATRLGSVGRLAAVRRPAHRRDRRAGARGAPAGVRRTLGRVRRRAEVPAADDARVRASAGRRAAMPDALEMVDDHARPDGRRAACYDQLGGGFARYSTDGAWHVPHFEKMLYDNAQLVQLYTRAWLVTRRRPTTARRGRDRRRTCCARCGTPTEGSSRRRTPTPKGVEGRFFTWSWDELVELVGEARRRGASAPRPRATGRARTAAHQRPVAAVAVAAVARERGIDPERWTRGRRGAARPVRGARGTRASRRRTTRSSRRGTRWRSARSRRRDAPSANRRASRPRSRCADVRAGRTCARRRPAPALVARRRRRRARVRGRPRAARVWRASRCTRPPSSPVGSREARRSGRRPRPARSTTTERGGFFQTGSTPTPWSSGPRSSTTTPSPAGTRWRPRSCSGSSHLTGDRDLERAGSSALRLVRDVMGRAPTGFGHALCAPSTCTSGRPARSAIVGEPGRRPHGGAVGAGLVRPVPARTWCSPSAAARRAPTAVGGRPAP